MNQGLGQGCISVVHQSAGPSVLVALLLRSTHASAPCVWKRVPIQVVCTDPTKLKNCGVVDHAANGIANQIGPLTVHGHLEQGVEEEPGKPLELRFGFILNVPFEPNE
ncbi:hypothetical protein GGD63_003364 [Bradyrhizobium sp. cir1]|nr:hypothetical protein [Bradyrhizobium sp. cir1]